MSAAAADGTPTLHGGVEPGFGPVADAFADNFRLRRDLGAGCVVFVDGVKVVDLWAGVADRRTGAPWAQDTAGALFSCTKGVVSVCVHLLVQDGVLDLDVPISTYWPQFTGHGKERTTLRHVLAHRAGLVAVDASLTREQVCAWDPPVRALERQRPLWEPGTAHSYHPVTFGWLAGEVVRRVTGRTPGTFLRERITGPRGLDLWIGIPESARRQLAWIEPPYDDDGSELYQDIAAVQASETVVRAMTMGEALPFPTENGVVTMNDPTLQAAELPGINGLATPRGLAGLYAACVSDVGGPRLLTSERIADAIAPQSWGQMFLGDPDLGQRWGTGFMISSPPIRPLLTARSFGHDGAGGQLGFADEDYRVGFGYVSNQMAPALDQRANELTSALRRCLGAPEPRRSSPDARIVTPRGGGPSPSRRR